MTVKPARQKSLIQRKLGRLALRLENEIDRVVVALRKLFRKKQVLDLFDHLKSGDIDSYSNWKGRYKENAEKMRSGHLFDMADVLKNLEHLSQRKALSYREKQMYEKAKYLIVSEIAIVEKQTEDKVEERIDEALQKALIARKKRKKSA